jgi:hypothetical protein
MTPGTEPFSHIVYVPTERFGDWLFERLLEGTKAS